MLSTTSMYSTRVPSRTPRLIVSPDVSRIRSSTGLAAAPSERSEGLANEKNASPSW